MLKLYSVFHLNLMFSSIEVEERDKVIQNCYWPLLELADQGAKIAIEATGLTLEIINEISPDWIKQLNVRIANGLIEFVGSGYAQIIAPLVPVEVNIWNQKNGLEVYSRLLGVKPEVVLVNEMAYSAGIIEIYRSMGYRAIIMEWNNPRAGHPEWENEWRYYPQEALGTNTDITIPVIWADSIAFQKFQRYAHGEYSLDDYKEYLKSHSGNNHRYFPFYSNDVEIFDFRPSRYKTEVEFEGSSEWHKIFYLYNILAEERWCEFVFPSEVLNELGSQQSGNPIQLESPAQPIPVKKQEKYNINRWALTGRDDLGINTICYKIYKELSNSANATTRDWKKLCYFWSSDFRTHITESRWTEYRGELKNCSEKWCTQGRIPAPPTTLIDFYPFKQGSLSVEKVDSIIEVMNADLAVRFKMNKGMTIESCIFKCISGGALFGALEHGFYDNISLAADFYSGHSLIEQPGKHKISDLSPVEAIISKRNDQIELSTKLINAEIEIETIARVSPKSIRIYKNLKLPERTVGIIHPFHITLNPTAWDKGSLFYSTCNGGEEPEIFILRDNSIKHKNIFSTLISAVDGLGSTDGILRIGDKNKCLLIKHDQSLSYLSPRIDYSPHQGEYFFLRVIYSAQEIDETFRPSTEPTALEMAIDIKLG